MVYSGSGLVEVEDMVMPESKYCSVFQICLSNF